MCAHILYSGTGYFAKPCDRKENPCCTFHVPLASPTLQPITIGCFRGCLPEDLKCVAQLTLSGTIPGYVPKSPRVPTEIFDPKIIPADPRTSAVEMPTNYLPSYWDIVTSNSIGTFETSSILSILLTFSEEVTVIGTRTV